MGSLKTAENTKDLTITSMRDSMKLVVPVGRNKQHV